MIRNFKRKSDELEKFIVDNEKGSVVHEIKLKNSGKHIILKSIQVLMVAHEENKSALYNTN